MRIIYTLNNSTQALNLIEPHAPLLTKPNKDTPLYKIISYRYFTDMIDRNYLYFSRVDTYNDDVSDSDAPNKDKEIHKVKHFQKCPTYTAYDY